MSPVYRDAYVLVDPRTVVLAQPFDGDGEHDGVYMLLLHIGVGQTLCEVYVRYSTLEERNHAFTKIAQMREAMNESLPLSCDFDLDTEEGDH